MGCYRNLLSEPLKRLAERPHRYHLVTERHIQALWLEQKYMSAFKLANGEPLQVLSPGIWNLDAGPDFRKAHLRIDGRDYFGDVEIHLNDHGWQQHGHHLDARYADTILHVSLWKSKAVQLIVNPQGKAIFQLYLEAFLTIPLMRLTDLIDLDLYPYKRFIGSGRCASELFKTLPEVEITAFFQQAAAWRLRQKELFFKSRINDPSHFVAAGIAMALGYKQNSEAFLKLFLNLSQQPLMSEKSALAWLMAQTGFFAIHYQKKWGGSPLYRELQEQAKLLGQNFDQEVQSIALNQIRPLNHPIRRFVYLAQLCLDRQRFTWREDLLALWQENWRALAATGKWTALRHLFLNLIPSYRDPYWNSHYLFELEGRSAMLPLMGENLKREIIVNTFLPLLYADLLEREAEQVEKQAFTAFYATFSASGAGKTNYLRHRFFGDSSKANLLKQGDLEQGAYQLHYDFCVHFEASCEGCPFTDRYRQTFTHCSALLHN